MRLERGLIMHLRPGQRCTENAEIRDKKERKYALKMSKYTVYVRVKHAVYERESRQKIKQQLPGKRTNSPKSRKLTS